MVSEMIIKIESAKSEGKDVSEIVTEYDSGNPLANFESFIHETEARKILKELVVEFKKDVEGIQKKAKLQED